MGDPSLIGPVTEILLKNALNFPSIYTDVHVLCGQPGPSTR